jgi:hypothetical protein
VINLYFLVIALKSRRDCHPAVRSNAAENRFRHCIKTALKESLELKFQAVNNRKKPVITATITKVSEELVKHIPKVIIVSKVVKKSDPVITLYVPNKKVETVAQDKPVNCWVKPLAVPEKDIVDDNKGWIEVVDKKAKKLNPESVPFFLPKDRNCGFDVLKDKTKIDKALTKTKMCNYGIKCSRGTSCRFAHSKSELTVRNCVFGDCCKFIQNIKGKIENKTGGKVCEYKHSIENIECYYQRVGM